MFNRKGAMFGLDARIALAIFGALSVISGAALYSAIQNSKATALLADLNEFGKAWESYYLDTGSDLPRLTGVAPLPHLAKVADLTSSAVSGWKGPYTSLKVKTSNTNVLTKLNNNDEYIIIYAKDTDWGVSGNDWYPTHICDSSNPCYAWVHVKGTGVDVGTAIDEIVDGGDGADKGKFRYRKSSDIYDSRYFLKYAPIQ